ncbi:hypothetical protein ACFS3C_07760 [Azotobacter vinelandii]
MLGLLTVLSLVAAFIAGYAEQRMEQTYRLRERLQGKLDSEATLATLLHIIATRPRVQNAYLLQAPASRADNDDPFSRGQDIPDIGALPHLKVDGQVYQGLGSSRFVLQDEGSLLSLLDPDRERWSALFPAARPEPAAGRTFPRPVAGLHRPGRPAPPQRCRLQRLRQPGPSPTAAAPDDQPRASLQPARRRRPAR